MSDDRPTAYDMPEGTIVVEIRTYRKTGYDTWTRIHSGETIRDGWIEGLFSDGIGMIAR